METKFEKQSSKSLTAIPEEERWLIENKEVFESIMQGIEDAEEGNSEYLGSFAEYAEDSSLA